MKKQNHTPAHSKVPRRIAAVPLLACLALLASSAFVHADPPEPSPSPAQVFIDPSSLSAVYDGGPRDVSYTTEPPGLSATVLYDGSPGAPTNAGTYEVSVTIDHYGWESASATGTLEISKAAATVFLDNLGQTYDGTSKYVYASSSAGSPNIAVTYDGSPVAPIDAGSYFVDATIDDPNYEGGTSGTLEILKAAATVYLGDLNHTYDGAPKPADASTSPYGIDVSLTYDGSPTAPTDVGNYYVEATINNPNYEGTASATLEITKATAGVSLGSLLQTFDGNPKDAFVETSPAGLPFTVTYNGSPESPVNAGNYWVEATIDDPNYQGSSADTLVVEKATAGVSFVGLTQTYDGGPKQVSATTTPDGLEVSVTYNGETTPPVDTGTYAVEATVNDPNYVGSASETLEVSKAVADIALSDLQPVYDGSAKPATVTTTPSGLNVMLTYEGSSEAPVNAGSYYVEATINDPNYEGATTGTLEIGKAVATVELVDLAATYDGTMKSAGVVTVPADLGVSVLYNGSSDLPVNAGSYSVEVTIEDQNHIGGTTGTLTIGKAPAQLELGDLTTVYDGTAKAATASTSPENLNVTLTYDGSSTAPTNAGSYPVVATIDDPNYEGSTTGSLEIAKGTASVTLDGLSAIYDGSPKPVSTSTSAGALEVTLTYDGSSEAPTNAGSYLVDAIINDPNYEGLTSGTLEIAKGTAGVTLDGLSATYDGTAKSVTATTTPENLSVTLTYNGGSEAPVNAGSYFVDAIINDPNYEGISSGTLEIAKGTAGVTLDGLSATYDGTAKSATATTTPEGLNVTLTYDGSSEVPVNAGEYLVEAEINDSNFEGSASGMLTIGKATVPVELGGLTATYDGTAKSATATTTPEGLNVTLTYDGSSEAPVNAGEYLVEAEINDSNFEGSASGTLTIGKATVPVELGGLTATYDGTAKSATVTTTPENLSVTLTYDGSSEAPTNAGSYPVVATIDDPNYEGSATGSLEIAKGTAGVTLDGLSATYDGAPKSATASTTPENLSVTLTYNGASDAPVNAGSYPVVATIDDPNYEGSATGNLEIAKGTASVTLDGLSATYDGTAKSATATTTPENLSVTLTYDGSTSAPTNAGSYPVVATIDDPNYEGSATGNLEIAKGTASVTLDGLSATYDGTAKSVTATTTPENLSVTLTYDGSTSAPTNAGSYPVVAAIDDPNYEGSATGNLEIAKGTASVTLDGLSATYDGTAKSATATTTPENLSVTLTYNGGSDAPVNAGSYFVDAIISDPNYEGSATGNLEIAKGTASVTLDGLSATYDGTAKSATATTTPENLSVTLTYDGSTSAPTNAGSYPVVATIDDPNYEGSATGNLEIAKGAASVTLDDLTATYDGTAKSATATTTPEGLSVTLTYNGGSEAPVNAGSYFVDAVINDPNYEGITSGTFEIAKGAAGVTLDGLSATYDGTAKSATATTTPEGLNVTLTYDGSSEAPVNAGEYLVEAEINDSNFEGSATGNLEIAKGAASVTLDDLTATYDGTAKSATATTTPEGLSVTLTYNGGSEAPVNAGSYFVDAIINDPNYEGITSGTLEIAKGTASVTLDALSATYDGTAKSATATTTPEGLNVTLTYDGSSEAPVNAGEYLVEAEINDSNFEGSASGTLTIGKATVPVELGGLTATYDGTAKSATATTTPEGLNVTLTYNGSSEAPVNAGSYAVVATVSDSNYSGSANGTLSIGKAAAGVLLGDLSATYDGTAKPASATTTPSGLSVTLTYNGSSTAPTNAGSYPVVATVSDANYSGSANGTLAIAKANQTVTFAGPGNLTFGVAPVTLAGSASSGLPVSFSVVSGAGSISGSTLNVHGAGSLVLRASQAGNTNYNAAVPVDATLAVAKATANITISNTGQTFSGSARPVTVATVPAGLATTVQYDGSSTAPSAVGQYAVTVAVNDSNYQGAANGTLTIYYAESSLAVVNPATVNEGRLVTVPIRLNSSGEVGGLTFRIQYDPVYLKAPDFKWLGRSNLGLADVVIDEVEGVIDASVSMAGQTFRSGVDDVAEIKFRTRSVPISSVLTPVEVTINDASDSNGDTLGNVVGALNGAIRISRRSLLGDINGNGFLDVSDATGVLRLLSGAEPGVAPTQTRAWDVALNDVNQNGTLTSGDVTVLLGFVSKKGNPPTLSVPQGIKPASASTNSTPGLEPSSLPVPEFDLQPQGSFAPMSVPPAESARLSSSVYSSANGTVTVQLVVENLATPITGLSFELNYPQGSLRLANSTATQTGTLIPGSGVSRSWNLATQSEFDSQTGVVRLASAGNGTWGNTTGIAATLVFQVLNDGGRDVLQPITVADLNVSSLEQGGVELRSIPVADSFYKRAIGEWAANNAVGSTAGTDSDKDGSSDLAEYLAGTDPKSQLSKFSVREIQRPGGAVTRIQWATVRGIRYRVTTTTDLANWSLVVGSESEGTGAIEEIDISGTSGETKRFFRVEIVP